MWGGGLRPLVQAAAKTVSQTKDVNTKKAGTYQIYASSLAALPVAMVATEAQKFCKRLIAAQSQLGASCRHCPDRK